MLDNKSGDTIFENEQYWGFNQEETSTRASGEIIQTERLKSGDYFATMHTIHRMSQHLPDSKKC